MTRSGKYYALKPKCFYQLIYNTTKKTRKTNKQKINRKDQLGYDCAIHNG